MKTPLLRFPFAFDCDGCRSVHYFKGWTRWEASLRARRYVHIARGNYVWLKPCKLPTSKLKPL